MIVGWAGMLVSVQAYALSLGGFQVQSVLDEPLRAEIRLESVDPATLDSLKVTLGTQEDFQRADVARAEFLKDLQFNVSSEGGTPVVMVTTEQPIKEPFLHFLIAAEWSGGKLVREYTGLLDPPLYASQPSSTVEPTALQPATAETAQATSTATTSETVTPSFATVTGRSAEYGPTQKGDTLWAIASKLDTGSLQVNVFQVMVALLRENPEAFINNNVNLLKTGQILRLKDIATIANVSAQEATTIYTVQLGEWESYKATVIGEQIQVAGGDAAAGTGTADDASSGQAATGGMPTASDQAAAAQGQEEDVLRIVQATLDETGESQRASAGTDQSGEIAELRGKIATLEESLESRDLENQELQERVRLLENQLENAQRLVEIESQELAAAQAQAAALAEAQQQAAAQQQEAAQRAAEEAARAQASAQQIAASTAEQDTQEQASSSTGQQSQSSQQASAVTPASGQETAQDTQKVRKVTNRPPQQSSWWSQIPDMLFSSWMWMVGAGVGVLVLLLGLLMFLRRRQSIAEFEESILSGSALDSYSESTDTAGSSASDTSFLSDFGTAGMGTMQADEVDPLAEAEVYLAYGRDEQAEEVLKEAARRDPDRSEVKLKLLEIYKQREDVKSFETIAEELYPAGDQGDYDTWSKVTNMGRELSPHNPLFLDAAVGETATITSNTNRSLNIPEADTLQSQPEQEQSFDELAFDMDTDDDTTPPTQVSTRQAPTTQHGTLDIGEDLLQTAPGDVNPATQPFPTPDQQTDLDRELERLASERETITTGVEKTATPAAEGQYSESDSAQDPDWSRSDSQNDMLDFPSSDNSEIDFDLDLDESSIEHLTESSAESQQIDRKQTQSLNADRGSVDGLMEFESANIPPEDTWAGPSTDAAPDQDGGELSSDEDEHSSATPEYSEAETKLDLARAYLDMGDKVGARSIIDEVMREGDPAQRDQAAELASQL